MSNDTAVARLLARRKLNAELRRDALKADSDFIKKRYTKCKDCGKEGCTDSHEPEKTEEVPETGSKEVELSGEDLAALLAE